MQTLRIATNIPHRGKLSDIAQGLLGLKGVKECQLEKNEAVQSVLRVSGEHLSAELVFQVLERAGYSACLLENAEDNLIFFRA